MAEESNANTTEKVTVPEFSRERIVEALKNARAGIAYDLEQHELNYPNATEATLNRVMTE